MKRIVGFDVARAFALFGMVIVNFKIAMGAETGSEWLQGFAALFEGRASALFVILAGAGVTFLTNRARSSSNRAIILSARFTLVKRGLLLVLIGLAYTPVWEADILHFYGCYFLIAAALFTVSDQKLLFSSVFFTLAFPVLMLFFDYEKNWNWVALSYDNLWSLDGMARHIVFNGFHPVFPWAAFLLFGMWLGRQDVSLESVRRRLFVWSLVVFVSTEVIFYLLRATIGANGIYELELEGAEFLFSTSIIPPLPQYVVSAASSAVMALVACLYLSEKFAGASLIVWLSKTGKMSLTLYVAHVIVGMGFLESVGLLSNQTIGFSLFSALVFCVGSVIFSVGWIHFFQVGPLEWVFRKVVK
jgi:uncharacterized membrane protein YeiB